MVKIEFAPELVLQAQEDALQDMRIFERLTDYAGSDLVKRVAAAAYIAERIYGAEGKEKIYAYLEQRDGKASPQEFLKMLESSFLQFTEAKKK